MRRKPKTVDVGPYDGIVELLGWTDDNPPTVHVVPRYCYTVDKNSLKLPVAYGAERDKCGG